MFTAITPSVGAQKMFDLPKKMMALPTLRESVDKAVSAENLKAVASGTTDPEVLLGLAFVAPAGDPVRKEMSDLTVRVKPEYAPIAAVLTIVLDGIDDQSIGGLIKRDPDNALGYYLQGTLLHHCDQETEALAAFRKAAHCSELRLYEANTGPALFKALDALNLKNHDRLCALSWMGSRSSNFSSSALQPVRLALEELARLTDVGSRREIPGLLLVLAGHLFGTNFYNRWFAKSAVESVVFGLKGRFAGAGDALAVNGYPAATAVPMGVMLRWPGIEAGMEQEEHAFRLARHLPGTIHRAFATDDPSQSWGTWLGDRDVNLCGSAKARFKQAKEQATRSAKALIDVAVTDADAILGAYLKGLPPTGTRADGRPQVPRETLVEKLIRQRPDLLKAAAANEEAMTSVWHAGRSDPRQRNMERMMEIGRAIFSYACNHADTYPNSIEILFEEGYLKPPLAARSLITGRPYVYVAAGEKVPVKSSHGCRFVVLYDDDVQGGYYECVMATWMGSAIKMDELREQLRKRGKEVS